MKDNAHATLEARLLDEAGLTDLPTHWGTTNVAELLADSRAIAVGVMYPGRHEPTGVPLLRVADLSGSRLNMNPEFRVTPEVHREYQRTELQGGELLMTLVGGLGQCCVAPPQVAGWNAARAIAVMRLKEPSEADFVRYCLLMPPVQYLINAWANTTVQATLNLKEVRQLPLPWPPKHERRAITDLLKALDDKIELNRQMNRTLEETAGALYRSWFVDFDPVVAKAAGRSPAHLSPALAALFPAAFQDSDLGPIPKGWQVRPIKDLYSAMFDGPHATPPDADDGPVFLGIRNLTGTLMDLTDLRHISEADYPRWTKRVTPTHLDIVFTYEATIGFCALVPPDLRCCLGRRLALVRTESGREHFVFHSMVGAPFQDLIASRIWSGSTVDRIPLTEFPNYPVLWPGDDLAAAFDAAVKPWWAMIHHNQTESQTLAALRDTLLPKLLSGEVRVKTLESSL